MSKRKRRNTAYAYWLIEDPNWERQYGNIVQVWIEQEEDEKIKNILCYGYYPENYSGMSWLHSIINHEYISNAEAPNSWIACLIESMHLLPIDELQPFKDDLIEIFIDQTLSAELRKCVLVRLRDIMAKSELEMAGYNVEQENDPAVKKFYEILFEK